MIVDGKKIFFALLAVMTLTWGFAAYFDVFERAYDLSRHNEAWELDEVFSFLILSSLSLPALVGFWNQRLRRSLLAQQEAEERANHVSRHDPLTGLHNRRVMTQIMHDRIEEARNGGPALAVLLMDLDRFKPINDLRGHDAGDRVLQEVARRLKAVCRPGQEPVRLGGDEFAVLVRETDDIAAATSLARRIGAALEEKLPVGENGIGIGASIGIAVWQEGIDESELLRRADQAMYRSKREGRGRINFFDDALGERLRAAAELELELNAAIEAGEIVPYFQPIVDMPERRLVGFEALARWNHARLGQVPPGRFIPIAEDIGRINAISWLVLRQACEAAKGWPEELSLSFNLSPKQFRDADLSKTISAVLSDTGFPPGRLELEVTESAVIEDLDHAREIIDQLKWLGIRISLDDFGTGFSSLATLSRLPFDRLKIDRSFVTHVTEDTQKAKIVAGIISLANSLELGVTAEGIETESAYEMLARLNCDLGQGYLFERPLPAEELQAWFDEGWSGVFARDAAGVEGEAARRG